MYEKSDCRVVGDAAAGKGEKVVFFFFLYTVVDNSLSQFLFIFLSLRSRPPPPEAAVPVSPAAGFFNPPKAKLDSKSLLDPSTQKF